MKLLGQAAVEKFTKTCSKCGEVKQMEEFSFKGVRLRHGERTRRAECKACQSAYNRSETGKAANKKYRLSGKGKKTRLKAKKKYQQTPKGILRERARNAARYFIRTRGIQRVCEICGTDKSVHAHHGDYTKAREVTLLCVKHHAEAHQ